MSAGGEGYGTLAPYYDAVMAHIDYVDWARHVRAIWKAHKVRPRRILELAAGTCRVAQELERQGLTVLATDRSAAMLERGAARVEKRLACDFRKIPLRDGAFDGVLCLYDAVNYCLETKDLDDFFAESLRVLRPGGTLLLDVTTAANSQRHFAASTSHETLRGAHIIRESYWDGHARMQHNLFTFFLPVSGGHFERLTEHHMQRVWPLASLKERAARAGFELLAALDEFTLEPVRRGSERVHLLWKRPLRRGGRRA